MGRHALQLISLRSHFQTEVFVLNRFQPTRQFKTRIQNINRSTDAIKDYDGRTSQRSSLNNRVIPKIVSVSIECNKSFVGKC